MTGKNLRKWRSLCYLQAALSLEAFSAPILIIFYTAYAGFTFAQYSSIISLIFVFLWVLEVPTGAFADRYGRKMALIAGNLVYLAAMICLVGLGHSAPWWLIALLFACGGSLSSGAFQSMMFDSYASEGRDADFHTVNARATSISLFSSGVASIVGGWLAARSLALPMYADIGVLAVLTLAFIAVLREPQSTRDARGLTLKAIIRTGVVGSLTNRALLTAILVAALVFACLRAGFNFYQPLLQASGASVETMGWLFAAFYGFSSLVAYAFSHIPKSALLSKLPGIAFIVLFAISAATLAFPMASSSIGLVLLAIACHQIGRGIYPSYSTYLINRNIPPGNLNRTTILSAASLVRAVLSASLIWCTGQVADSAGFSASFVFLSGVTASLIIVTLFFGILKNESELTPVAPAGD
jgi:MFS family permease